MLLIEQEKENVMDFFLSFFFLVKAVIDEVLIPFFFINWLKSQKNKKKKLATFPPACFCCEFAVLEIGAVRILMLFTFCLLPFCAEQNRKNITKMWFFSALKTEREGST